MIGIKGAVRDSNGESPAAVSAAGDSVVERDCPDFPGVCPMLYVSPALDATASISSTFSRFGKARANVAMRLAYRKRLFFRGGSVKR